MRITLRVLTTGLLSVVLLGVVGCGENNQTVVEKQASTGTVAAKAENVSDQKSFMEQQQKSNSLKQSGYPGAK